jgi:Tfp pilus assembly protein PilF
MKNFVTCITMIFLLASCATGSPKKSEKEKKAELFYSYGTSNLVNKKYTEALTNLMQAAKYDPSDSKIQNNLGMAYYFKKDKKSAIRHIRRAIKLDENNNDAKVNIASIYYNDENYRAAKKYYQLVKKSLTYKNQFRVSYNLGLIEFKMGNSKKALENLDEALSENEDYCPAHFLRGRIYEVKRDYKNAYDSYRKSYHGPCYNNPAPHFKAAVMLTKNGDYLKARLKFNEIMERFSTSTYSAKSNDYLRLIQGKSKEREYSNNKLKKLEDEVKSYQSTDF